MLLNSPIIFLRHMLLFFLQTFCLLFIQMELFWLPQMQYMLSVYALICPRNHCSQSAVQA